MAERHGDGEEHSLPLGYADEELRYPKPLVPSPLRSAPQPFFAHCRELHLGSPLVDGFWESLSSLKQATYAQGCPGRAASTAMAWQHGQVPEGR